MYMYMIWYRYFLSKEFCCSCASVEEGIAFAKLELKKEQSTTERTSTLWYTTGWWFQAL